jgi:4-hydroxyphenylpyruvate dioxygenase
MPTPNEVYYARIDKRLPKHGEDLERLRRNGILIDGEGVVEGGFTKVLLQRFGQTAIGPIFFEFISARATTASARATSRRCSSRSRKTRSAAAC